ncbi:DNA polymerase alpha catalytic subunit-like [Miscanthus floridulus]|uniref:DNA polymerase alpha catalytic subunit-like n=1 Tax=Miscanthus floridulus TaxID=154761 RepID=UPI00345A4BE7
MGSLGVPFTAAAAAAAGSGGAGAGGKVGLPALDVALAFPQATPASLFPPAGCNLVSDSILCKYISISILTRHDSRLVRYADTYWEKAEFPFHAIPSLASLGLAGGTIKVFEKYVITKSLTKAPEDYPDAKSQPHVQVALRLKQNGYSGCSAGDTVPYLICSQQDSDNTHSMGIAQGARHPEELKRDPDKWMIDIDYCLSQQIHPVVSRLCASIQGTSLARLAECLGLDSAKFQSRVTESSNQDTSTMLLSVIDDEDERYHGCEPLRLSCPSCFGTFDCPPVSSLITSSTSVSYPNNVLCKTLLDDVLCKTRLYVIYVLISM